MKEYMTETIRLLYKEEGAGAAGLLDGQASTQHVQNTADGLFNERDAAQARRFHKSIPRYEETRLVRLSGAAAHYGIRDIYVKDESTRFGLKAFKGLGGSYSMFRILCDKLGLDPKVADYQTFCDPEIRARCAEITFVTATDGNHGKGVSWAAGLFGCQAHVFMPKGSVEARRRAIEEAGSATAVITDLNYDQTVEYANQLGEKNGWILIQDTAWEGYQDIPRWIIEGYLTLGAEAAEQLEAYAAEQLGTEAAEQLGTVDPAGPSCPTHVFLQAGVGAMAGGITAYLLQYYREAPPRIFIVEPETVACIYLSAAAGDGMPHSVEGDPETIMAGLNCGTPCSITWPVLRDGAAGYIACADSVAERGMRAYHDPVIGDRTTGLGKQFPSSNEPGATSADEKVISGESGAATYGAVLTILENEELRTLCGIDEDSIILLVNTEGDTDPENYERVINNRN